MKRCYDCGHEQPLSNFYKKRSSKDGHGFQCKECKKAESRDRYASLSDEEKAKAVQRAKQWREENPHSPRREYERNRNGYLARAKEWALSNPEKRRRIVKNYKARRRSWEGTGSVSEEEWNELCAFYGNRCLACGKSTELTQDHVIPLSRNGEHSIANIQPLCMPCNQAKSTKIIDYRKEHYAHYGAR